MKQYGLPKAYRLRKRVEFIPKRGKSRKVHTRSFTVICSRNRGQGPRIGIVASRRVGNAVTRNRVKRLIREFFRLNRGKIQRSEDIIVIARPMARVEKYGDIEEELKCIL